MGVKYVCDWCGKEVQDRDMRIVKIEKTDGTPADAPHEICVFCREKLLTAITEIIRKIAADVPLIEGGQNG